MKISNPILLLVLIVSVNALLIAAICLNVKLQVPQPEEKMKILVLCALSFLSTASLALVLGNKLLGSFIEPMESSASKILAVLSGRDNPDATAAKSELPELADQIITELETSRQRERLIADYSSDILCCVDEQRRLLDLNIQSESVWEYPIISLLATPLDTLIYPEDKDIYLEYFDACKTQYQEKPLECRAVARDGRVIDLEWQVEWSPSLHHFFCLAKNISDRKANQRLKAEITAMVGHDLRAPVSSLSFLLENLRAGTFGGLSPEAEEKVEKARDNVSQMLKLINQLLDAEKLEGGQMEVDLKIIPLSELYESCADLLQDLAARQKVSIKFPQDSTFMAMADFDRSVQILCNLVSNAIKWSPPDSCIEVTEKVDHKMIVVSVSDKGPGIAADRQKAIFERFKSLDQRADKSIASSGLGLYIAKKLIELQGGSIGVISKPGEGSSFWISMKPVNEKDMPGYLEY